MLKPRIAILGSGPAGLEAALYARALGYPVTVYERGKSVATHIRQWGFVKLFTPWRMNVSPLGVETLRCAGLPPPPADEFPTGEEFVHGYLEPIARSLQEELRLSTQVVGVSKIGLLKTESIGGKRRATIPFRLLVDFDGHESEETADIVLDATGVYGSPARLGDGGLAAIGERDLDGTVVYHLIDILGSERARFAGKTTLLVGAGFSAATALVDLIVLGQQEPGTRCVWARRTSGPTPFPTYSADPLPLRARLGVQGNEIAANPPSHCRTLSGVAVRAIEKTPDGLRVRFRPVDGGGTDVAVDVDNILAHCGYRPNIDLFRELQIHQCYATEGPMNLAAALLSKSGGTSDCLTQSSLGVETIKSPEPLFFILGHKSYGRRNDFLMLVAREQITDVFRLLENDPELDLYATRESY